MKFYYHLINYIVAYLLQLAYDHCLTPWSQTCDLYITSPTP